MKRKRMRPEGVLPKPSVKHQQQIPSSTAHTVRLCKMLPGVGSRGSLGVPLGDIYLFFPVRPLFKQTFLPFSPSCQKWAFTSQSDLTEEGGFPVFRNGCAQRRAPGQAGILRRASSSLSLVSLSGFQRRGSGSLHQALLSFQLC